MVKKSDEDYDVEKIVNKKIVNGKLFYFVKWEGYSDEDNTWEPAKNLSHLDILIKRFEKK